MSTLAARLLGPRRPGIKPRPGVWRLNRKHPLVQGLRFFAPLIEGVGAPVELVRSVPLTVNTGASWAVGLAGVGATGDGTNAPYYSDDHAIDSGGGSGAGAFTVALIDDLTASASLACRPFVITSNTGAANNSLGWRANATSRTGAVTSGDMCLWTRSGADSTVSATGVVDGRPHVRVVTRAASGGSLVFYNDGVVAGSNAPTERDFGPSARVTLGANGDLTTEPIPAGRRLGLAAFWDRELAAAEVLAFSCDPWALLATDLALWPVGFQAAGGTTVTYAATVQTSSVPFVERKTSKPVAAALAATSQVARKASKGVVASASGAASVARTTFKGLAATANAIVAFLASSIAALLVGPARLTLGDGPATACQAADAHGATVSTGDAPAATLTIDDADAA